MDERATRRLGGQAGSSANAGNLPELGSKLIGKKKRFQDFSVFTMIIWIIDGQEGNT